MRKYSSWAGLVLFLLAGLLASGAPAGAAILNVGPGQKYATPCQAIAVAAPGDTILIQAGLYRGDVCAWSTNNLTLRGVNGIAHLDAAHKIAEEKGIWVPTGNNTVVENIEFSGAAIPPGEGNNGAGIRFGGVNLTVRNCIFLNNQDGILEDNIAGSHILVEFSEFDHNGAGDGQSHNIYIGHAAQLIFRYNWSHRAVVGHLLKTRAAVNFILYNRLTEEDGTGSYETDVPNGGTTYFIGNLIQQGPESQNHTILTYLEEGTSPSNPGQNLYVINNTFVNQASAGTFVNIGSEDTVPAILENNIFYGPGTITNESNAVLTTNFTGNPDFVNLDDFNYHLLPHSPAINAGTEPGVANGFSLVPEAQYVQPACGQQRIQVGTIDIGAYEFGGGGTVFQCR